MSDTYRTLFLVAIIFVAGQAPAALAESGESTAAYLSVAVGHVAVFDNDVEEPAVFKLEYRFTPIEKWWGLAPAIGAARSEAGASFVFADVEKDFFLSSSWVFTPSFGAGLFDDGVDVKLGNDLEFRSGVKLAYQFANKSRLSLGLFHLSNGGLSDRNPGTEPAFVAYAFAFE